MLKALKTAYIHKHTPHHKLYNSPPQPLHNIPVHTTPLDRHARVPVPAPPPLHALPAPLLVLRPRHDDAPGPRGAPAGPIDAHGPGVAVLTDPTPGRDEPCVARAVLPPGAATPAHSHSDRVAFYVVAGELEGQLSRPAAAATR